MNTKTLYFAIGLVLLGVIIYLLIVKVFPSDPDETEAFSCGNGKTVFRYKNPSKAFPVITREYNANFNATTDILKKVIDSALQVSLTLDAKNKVIELQEKLNQDNITFSTALRSYFFSCNSDPCNAELQAKYITFIDSMSIRMLELRKFVVQSTKSEEKGTAVIDTTNAKRITIEKDPSRLMTAIINLDAFIKRK